MSPCFLFFPEWLCVNSVGPWVLCCITRPDRLFYQATWFELGASVRKQQSMSPWGFAKTDSATVRRDPCARPLFRTDHANEGPQISCEILEKESEKLLEGLAR